MSIQFFISNQKYLFISVCNIFLVEKFLEFGKLTNGVNKRADAVYINSRYDTQERIVTFLIAACGYKIVVIDLLTVHLHSRGGKLIGFSLPDGGNFNMYCSLSYSMAIFFPFAPLYALLMILLQFVKSII